MFFRTGALKNVTKLEFLFKKVAGLQACNFIEKRLQHKCFSVKIEKSLRVSFLQNTSGDCFWKYLFNSLYCIWEWWIVSLRGMYWLSSSYLILLRAFSFFLFLSFFSYFFVNFTTWLDIVVNLSIPKTKQWSCS